MHSVDFYLIVFEICVFYVYLGSKTIALYDYIMIDVFDLYLLFEDRLNKKIVVLAIVLFAIMSVYAISSSIVSFMILNIIKKRKIYKEIDPEGDRIIHLFLRAIPVIFWWVFGIWVLVVYSLLKIKLGKFRIPYQDRWFWKIGFSTKNLSKNFRMIIMIILSGMTLRRLSVEEEFYYAKKILNEKEFYLDYHAGNNFGTIFLSLLIVLPFFYMSIFFTDSIYLGLYITIATPAVFFLTLDYIADQVTAAELFLWTLKIDLAAEARVNKGLPPAKRSSIEMPDLTGIVKPRSRRAPRSPKIYVKPMSSRAKTRASKGRRSSGRSPTPTA
jgi:hypothetical protein